MKTIACLLRNMLVVAATTAPVAAICQDAIVKFQYSYVGPALDGGFTEVNCTDIVVTMDRDSCFTDPIYAFWSDDGVTPLALGNFIVYCQPAIWSTCDQDPYNGVLRANTSYESCCLYMDMVLQFPQDREELTNSFPNGAMALYMPNPAFNYLILAMVDGPFSPASIEASQPNVTVVPVPLGPPYAYAESIKPNTWLYNQVRTPQDTSANVTLLGCYGCATNGGYLGYGSLTFTIVTSPTNGILTGLTNYPFDSPNWPYSQAAANVTYLPAPGFIGEDSFTFQATDVKHQMSNIATVSITVTQGVDKAAPSITTQPTDQTVPLGSNATFTVTATGTAPLAYQWVFNGTALTDNGRIIGCQTDTLLINEVTKNDVGNYYVVVSNGYGSTNSDVAALSIASSVSTLAPTSLGNTSAILNGSINSTGSAATVYFQYGTDTNYGTTTASIDVGSGQNIVTFSNTIDGLDTNTVYHYQAVGVVDAVPYVGQDQTVTTEPSLLVLASLSLYAYQDNPTNYSGPPDYTYLGGFSRFVTRAAPADFSVAAYTSLDTNQVVVAFRGTVPPPETVFHLHNVMADWGFYHNTPSATLGEYTDAAVDFAWSVLNAFPNANVTLTGHSLGGGLAQMVGAESGLAAVGFNAPGGQGIYNVLRPALPTYLWPALSNGYDNRNYRLKYDIVSQVGTPFAHITTLAVPPSLSAIAALISFDTYTDPFNILTATEDLYLWLQAHSMELVISQIKGGAVQSDGFNDNVTFGPVLKLILNAPQLLSTLSSVPGQTVDTLSSVSSDTAGVIVIPSQSEPSDFLLSANAGSPSIAAIDLPFLNGVSFYPIRSQNGGNWSAFQEARPGVPYAFDPVTAVEFVPLDGNANPVIISNLVCGVYFASTGAFSGAITATLTTFGNPPMLSSNLIVNGGFETPVAPVGLYLASTIPSGWSSSGDKISLISVLTGQ